MQGSVDLVVRGKLHHALDNSAHCQAGGNTVIFSARIRINAGVVHYDLYRGFIFYIIRSNRFFYQPVFALREDIVFCRENQPAVFIGGTTVIVVGSKVWLCLPFSSLVQRKLCIRNRVPGIVHFLDDKVILDIRYVQMHGEFALELGRIQKNSIFRSGFLDRLCRSVVIVDRVLGIISTTLIQHVIIRFHIAGQVLDRHLEGAAAAKLKLVVAASFYCSFDIFVDIL